MQGEVKANVAEGSEVFTDAAQGYRGLDEEYIHEFVDHAVQYAEGRVHTNGLENFWSLTKRMLKGTYVSVEPEHLLPSQRAGEERRGAVRQGVVSD